MALFRYYTEKGPLYIELHYEGGNYTKAPITALLTKKNENGEYEMVQNLGEINYEKEQAQAGYHFKSQEGDIELKWEKKFLIISIMKVLLNGSPLKGSEVLMMNGVLAGKYI